MYSVTIKNCNNILEGNIIIEKGKLNIKYGINGTGKTSVAKALKMNNDGGISELQSFLSESSAEVILSEPISSILAFNEEFVNNVVFKEDEVIENTFEVFLKTDSYDLKKGQLDAHLESLHKIIRDGMNVNDFRNLLATIYNKFSIGAGGIPKRTGTYKSILAKANIYSVPEELTDYKEFFEDSEIAIPWIDWKKKGDVYDSKSRCPYCSEKMNRVEYDKKKAVFSKTYSKAESQNLKEILDCFEALEPYLVPEEYKKLVKYVKEDTAETVISVLISKLLGEIGLLLSCFDSIEEFGNRRIAIADISKLDADIKNMCIPTDVFSIFGGVKVEAIWQPINDAVNQLKVEIGILKRELGELKAVMQATIQKSQQDINEFLKTAGINYELSIQAEDENSSKTILKQCFTSGKTDVKQIRKHLSWGERNAFSLVLFMYYAVQQNPDLIILDDPISSFDSNKKYAILHRLFKDIGKQDISFENRTVLLLTHDFEPIVDFAVVGKLGNNKISTYFIWNEKGILQEKKINVDHDIVLITEHNESIAKDENVNVIARVASLRLLSELYTKDGAWRLVYEILSSLIHGQEVQVKLANGKFVKMEDKDLQEGLALIKEYIADFDYKKLKETVYTESGVREMYSKEHNPYFKMQLFRELKEISNGSFIKLTKMDEAWFKFIDETYHIENSSLYTLDIRNYNTVPSYIVQIVDDAMANLVGAK